MRSGLPLGGVTETVMPVRPACETEKTTSFSPPGAEASGTRRLDRDLLEAEPLRRRRHVPGEGANDRRPVQGTEARRRGRPGSTGGGPRPSAAPGRAGSPRTPPGASAPGAGGWTRRPWASQAGVRSRTSARAKRRSSFGFSRATPLEEVDVLRRREPLDVEALEAPEVAGACRSSGAGRDRACPRRIRPLRGGR